MSGVDNLTKCRFWSISVESHLAAGQCLHEGIVAHSFGMFNTRVG